MRSPVVTRRLHAIAPFRPRCRHARLLSRRTTVLALGLLVVGACAPATLDYDLVLSGGRVMDPETGLDAVRYVGILDGTIASLSETPLEGVTTVDATGLVVAPGFIDLHAHGQSEEAYGYMVRDGVTTALELEVGTGNVTDWYAQREGGQIVNYGVSIGHIPVRMAQMGDPGDFLPAGPGGSRVATSEEIQAMAEAIAQGLEEGAVGVGFGLAYTPAATTEEFEAMLRVGAQARAPAYIHVRGGGPDGATEAITAAAITGASLHVVHANSSGGAETDEFLRRIQVAVDAGQDVTTEAYPYSAGQTRIESALFDDWESYDDERFGTHQWVATGERLTRETFGRYRQQGGSVIIHSRTEEMTRAAIGSPLTMIASDGGITNGSGHPRSTGSFSKVLGRYARDEGLFSLMDALAKMTIRPAHRLEGRVPAMARKGRVQEGADADLVLFDPETVIDRSTYTEPTLTPEGIPWVLVGGVVVVERGELKSGVRPGRPVRAN